MTLIQRYEGPQHLLADCQDFLLADPLAHNRIHHILKQLAAKPMPEHALLYRASRNGATVGVGLMNTPLPARCLCIAGQDQAVADAMAAALREAGVALTAVEGRAALAGYFAGIWGNGRRHMHFGSLHLSAEPSAPTIQGALRCASVQDTPLLCEWLANFRRDCGLELDTDIAKDVAERLSRQQPFFRLWEVDGVPHAMIGAAGDEALYRIGAVYTPPHHRGRGHGGAMTTLLCRQLRAQGVRDICLYTDLANPTSNAMYERIGFVRIGEFAEYRFDVQPT